jgi:hypothetical protein
MRKLIGLAVGLVLGTLLCGAGGCVAHGVHMVNKTGRTLNVEYIRVNKDGTLTEPYSRALLSPDAEFNHHPPIGDGYVGERVRFALTENAEVPGNSILVHMPDNKTREFDIVYTSGRLYIREYKKGRDWSQVGEPGHDD